MLRNCPKYIFTKSEELFRRMLANSGLEEAAAAQNRGTLTAERHT